MIDLPTRFPINDPIIQENFAMDPKWEKKSISKSQIIKSNFKPSSICVSHGKKAPRDKQDIHKQLTAHLNEIEYLHK